MNRSMLNGFRSSVGMGQQNFYNQDQRSNSMYQSPYQQRPQQPSFQQQQPPQNKGFQPMTPTMPQFGGGMGAYMGEGGVPEYEANPYSMQQGGSMESFDQYGFPQKPATKPPISNAPAMGGNNTLQPAMPQFRRDNPRAGLRPGAPYWNQLRDMYQGLRNRRPNAGPPKGDDGYLDPVGPPPV